MTTAEYLSQSVDDTVQFGCRLGARLQGGEIFAVTGPLGAGKTHFTKGLAMGAGAQQVDEVNSPTFVLVNEYDGPLPVYHIDAYRLTSTAQFEQLGFDELLGPDSVVLVEWADRVAESLADLTCVHVEIRHEGPSSRRIRIDGAPSYLIENGPQGSKTAGV